MRMPLWVAGPCIILGAILGALVAWSLSNEPASRVAPAPDVADFPADPPETPPTAPLQPAPPASSVEPPPPLPTTSASVDLPAPVTSPSPTTQIGNGAVTGRVIDQHDRGIADVEVVLVLSTDTPAPEEPQRRHFDSDAAYEQAYLQFAALRLRHDAAITRRTISDDQGDFVLDQLPDIEGRISANADGYRFQQQSEHRAVKPGSQVTIEGVRLGGLRVVAAYQDGSAPESGVVRVQREDGSGRAITRTWESLKSEPVELDPGTYRATFTGREPPGTGLSDSVEVREGEVAEVRVDLQALARLKVTLEFGNQRPTSCSVSLYHTTDDGSRGNRASSSTVRSPSTDATLGDVEPGDYVVVVRSGQTDLAEQSLSLNAGVTDLSIRAGEPDGSEYIEVTVNVPSSGDWNADRAFIRLTGPVQNVDAWHLGDNRFRVFYSIRTGRRGNIMASVTVGGLGSLSKQIEPGRDRSVDFTFLEPATLTVRVTNVPEGLNPGSVRLSLADDDSTARQTSIQSVSVPGKPRDVLVRFRAGQPISGVLRFASGEMARVPGLETRIQLQPGHTETQWALPELHRLTIVAEFGDGVSRANFRLSTADDQLIGTRSVRQNGQRTTYSYLTGGAYNLRATAIGGQSSQRDYSIQVYSDTEQRITVLRE